MVSERGVQLRVVRSIFRALPFLASVAGPAKANFKFQISNLKFVNVCDRDCCAAFAVSTSPF